jgi:hypothetical protein
MKFEVSILRSNGLKLVSKIIGVYCENHKKHIKHYEGSICKFLMLKLIVNIIF